MAVGGVDAHGEVIYQFDYPRFRFDEFVDIPAAGGGASVYREPSSA